MLIPLCLFSSLSVSRIMIIVGIINSMLTTSWYVWSPQRLQLSSSERCDFLCYIRQLCLIYLLHTSTTMMTLSKFPRVNCFFPASDKFLFSSSLSVSACAHIYGYHTPNYRYLSYIVSHGIVGQGNYNLILPFLLWPVYLI